MDIRIGPLVAALAVATVLGILPPLPANAALLSRLGGQAMYDTLLDITWVADPLLARTSGYDGDGQVDQAGAIGFIGHINSTAYLGYTDWRLPQVRPVNGIALDVTPTFDGSTDRSYNVSAEDSAHPGSTASELANLYYTSLGNDGYWTVAGTVNSSGTCCLQNTGPFAGLGEIGILKYFWTSTTNPEDETQAFLMNYATGGQTVTDKRYDSARPWAVRDGDIAVVPVPGASTLLCSALITLLPVRRRPPTLAPLSQLNPAPT